MALLPGSLTRPDLHGGPAAGGPGRLGSFNSLLAQPNELPALQHDASENVRHGAGSPGAATAGERAVRRLGGAAGPGPLHQDSAVSACLDARAASLQPGRPAHAAPGGLRSPGDPRLDRSPRWVCPASTDTCKSSSTDKHYTVHYIGVTHGELGILARRQVSSEEGRAAALVRDRGRCTGSRQDSPMHTHKAVGRRTHAAGWQLSWW
jgi:hypothetical protein